MNNEQYAHDLVSQLESSVAFLENRKRALSKQPVAVRAQADRELVSAQMQLDAARSRLSALVAAE